MRIAIRWIKDALRTPGVLVGWCFLVAMLGYVAASGSSPDCSQGQATGSWGAFSCSASDLIVYLLPAFSGMMASVLAVLPVSRGEDRFYRVRGVSRARLLYARIGSACACAATVIGGACLAAIALSVVLLPWRREALRPPSVYTPPGVKLPDPGLSPLLWELNPLLHDVVLVGVLMVATAALTSVGVVAGLLFRQPLAALMGPFLLVAGFQLVPVWGLLGKLMPVWYLVVAPRGELKYVFSGEAMFAMLAYWSVVLGVCVGAVVLLSRFERGRV